MKTHLFVGTHHKGGTVWMQGVFRDFAKRTGKPYVNMTKDPFDVEQLKASAGSTCTVLFHPHSKFPRPFARAGLFRGLHVIRDPRDLIVSAMHYHLKAKEAWLHVAREEFGGRTYQETINALPTGRERILFEMQNSARNVIRAMGAWDYAQDNVFEARYEELIVDDRMLKFREFCEFAGMDRDEAALAIDSYWANSLWGGKAERKGKGAMHIRSGASQQWRAEFDAGIAQAFLETFGDVLVKLGYEPDDAWARL